MDQAIARLKEQVKKYNTVLANTIQYRKQWKEGLKAKIVQVLTDMISETGLKATVQLQEQVENLEAVELDLGRSSSGIVESLANSDVQRVMIKANGLLVYQQLFNGKIMVMIGSPHIEGHGDPKPLRTIEILRPDELSEAFIVRHIEALVRDITEWEDFDDDDPKKTPIGFHPINHQESGL